MKCQKKFVNFSFAEFVQRMVIVIKVKMMYCSWNWHQFSYIFSVGFMVLKLWLQNGRILNSVVSLILSWFVCFVSVTKAYFLGALCNPPTYAYM